jgi:hypothetical protein
MHVMPDWKGSQGQHVQLEVVTAEAAAGAPVPLRFFACFCQ